MNLSNLLEAYVYASCLWATLILAVCAWKVHVKNAELMIVPIRIAIGNALAHVFILTLIIYILLIATGQ